MSRILFKFMRAKYSEGVKAGKVRGQLAEYITFGDWKLEINFNLETINVVTPTRHSVINKELFEAVLDAILTGDTTYIDKLVSAVKIADIRGVKVKGNEGDIKVTDAYFKTDGTIGVWVQVYGKDYSNGYRRRRISVTYDNFINTIERAGAF